jgi:hypothetical protein
VLVLIWTNPVSIYNVHAFLQNGGGGGGGGGGSGGVGSSSLPAKLMLQPYQLLFFPRRLNLLRILIVDSVLHSPEYSQTFKSCFFAYIKKS